ncbi:MAG TPA: hypothetical protein VGG83_05685 [Trebonia sp.]|jgi:hypothetical protein
MGRASTRGSLAVRLTVLLVAAIASAVGAWLGAWWVPFLVGAAVGLLGAVRSGRLRGTLLPAVIGAILGWLLPIWVLALRGQPVGATARAIAGLAGLPPYAGVMLAVVALLAALQVWVGAWLIRALVRRDGDTLPVGGLSLFSRSPRSRSSIRVRASEQSRRDKTE